MKKIRLGTRVSNLAMIQAKFVEKLLIQKNYEVEIIGMKTQGDMILDKPLAEIGDKGLFTKELETALQGGFTNMSRRWPNWLKITKHYQD